jgi:hypothetical protein
VRLQSHARRCVARCRCQRCHARALTRQLAPPAAGGNGAARSGGDSLLSALTTDARSARQRERLHRLPRRGPAPSGSHAGTPRCPRGGQASGARGAATARAAGNHPADAGRRGTGRRPGLVALPAARLTARRAMHRSRRKSAHVARFTWSERSARATGQLLAWCESDRLERREWGEFPSSVNLAERMWITLTRRESGETAARRRSLTPRPPEHKMTSFPRSPDPTRPWAAKRQSVQAGAGMKRMTTTWPRRRIDP